MILLIAAVYRRALMDARRDPEAQCFLDSTISDWRQRDAGKHTAHFTKRKVTNEL